MMEQAKPRKRQGDAVAVAGLDHQPVADGAAWLGDVAHAAAGCAVDVVRDGEESVAAQRNVGELLKPRALFLGGEHLGLFGKERLPDAVGQHIVPLVADIAVDGVVAVGFHAA